MEAARGGGEGAELRLLGTWSSPWVIRVKVALGLKGLSYEYVEEVLASKSDLLLKSNPVHKKVPVLIHGGRAVCESVVILQYVDEVWAGASGTPILPSDPYDRATARFWATYVNDTVATWHEMIQCLRVTCLQFFPSWRALFRSTTDEQRTEAFKNVVPVVDTLERALRECSKGKAFFGGDAVGLVDVALGSHLVWISVVDEVVGVRLLDKARFPALAAWAERFLAVDAVKEVMPDVRKVMEQYKGFLAKWIASAGPS
ncbi:hypothetical protein EJB05_17343 [Eragrostis curvula]|uniref:glutathione transferase n=1 Tax=Eragrostis curvula TaxID=38414 RepID=A0A5J9VH45_9POAL|nr:hypothetical protein EJB05_17343 [Eragrostis curvula]